MKRIIAFAIFISVIVGAGLLFFYNSPIQSAFAMQEQKLTGKEKHQIDLPAATRLIKNHRTMRKSPNVIGGFFGRDAIDKILAQPNVIGIRYYYAETNDSASTLIIVGVDNKGQDIQTGFIADIAIPCPPFCDPTSVLSK